MGGVSDWSDMRLLVLLGLLFGVCTAHARPSTSVRATVGTQSMGFAPTNLHPTLGLGLVVGLVDRDRLRLRVGAELGGFWQAGFAEGGHLDAILEVDVPVIAGVSLGAELPLGLQVSTLSRPGWRHTSDEGFVAARPGRLGGRVGLGAVLGYDIGRTRVFARYRQLAWTPFMPANEVPLMGVATVSVGVAVPL